MEGPHDLGGRMGFGPIDVREGEEPFHADWEGRVWAMRSAHFAPEWTLDWWRHVRECIPPEDYLTRPYFDSWAQTQLAAYVDSGYVTLEEAATGRAAAPQDPGAKPNSAKPMSAEDVRAATTALMRFDRPINVPPKFALGDRVTAKRIGTRHHCRLPAYAMGRPGVIHAQHGGHVFADAAAQGDERAEHLYTVAFAARDLWPEAADRRDRVFVDLWESHLEG